MNDDKLHNLINSLRDDSDLPKFRKWLLNQVAVSIGKPLHGHKGDPDYIIKGKRWDIWVFPDKLTVKQEPWQGRHYKDYTYGDSQRTLYDLLESKGSTTMAMLYIKELDPWHPTYNIKDLPDLSTMGIVKHLIHYILWEPRKIKWVDFIPLTP